ncbi:MAG: hypothetical protein ACRD08_02225 [Acidimicrobiales bacterium]
MRKLIGSVVLAAALITLPAVAAAQAHGGAAAKHEFGVDLAFVYASPDGGDGYFNIGTPVDLRVGFVSGEKLTIEPRLTLLYTSDLLQGGGGDSGYDFDLGLNLTYGMSPGGNKKGLYLTGGAAVELFDLGGGSDNFITFNGGIGTRAGYGDGAFRPEAFFSYRLENTDAGVPSEISFGLRLGLSLWH